MQLLSQQDIDIDKYTVFEKKISVFLALFGILMLLSSTQLFNSAASLQTTAPADGTVCPSSTVAKLIFDARGTYSPPYREFTITGGTFQIYSDCMASRIL